MTKGIFNRRNKVWSKLLIIIVAVMVLLFTTSMTSPAVNSSKLNKTSNKQQTVVSPSPNTQVPQIDNVVNAEQHVYETVQCGVMKYRALKKEVDQIPLYCISGKYAVGDGPLSSRLNTTSPIIEHLDIPIRLKPQLAAYWLSDTSLNGGHLVVAPKGWKAEEADTGANGSVSIKMVDPVHPDRQWVYQDVGGCQGCAISMIGSYFPKLEAWADQQGFSGEHVKFNSQSQRNKHDITYTLSHKNQSYNTFGAAYQNYDEEGAVFTKLEVSMPREQSELVQTMMDSFFRNPSYSNWK
ncbi:DUF4850 domain-containing protein [Paenibacillus pini]|uniref:DUF4850 domain-containing protein n=1 Tax=Paenibacillus pini JCM 16418 TaxID=1236976 RepID=W7YF01_9BACL|nr:DUF4850 domain-containing protein [Paenibacillus pini]GAF09540.1 hypothetical protein JCM16418_3683 [Paenibacillus pini JCM 16418]